MMGSGIGEGVDRAEDAIRQAIASPLLEDVDVKNAKGLLINITSNGSLTNGEFKIIGDHIGSLVDEDEADVIVGTTIDSELEDKIKVTVVATGMNNSYKENEKPEQVVDIVLQDSALESRIETQEIEETLITSPVAKEECDISFDEESLLNFSKEDEYGNEKNEKEAENNQTKDNKIEHKKNSNGELDLDFLDIPAFLRKQAD